MQFKKFAFFAILSALFYSGCGDSDVSNNEEKNKVTLLKDRKVFLTTTDNKVLSAIESKEGLTIQEHQGKAVLINFFATWCPPCKAEIPHLNSLKKKYEGKFEIVGVLLEENKDINELNAFMNKFQVQYPITNSEQNYELAKVLGGVNSIPTMFMYNKEGKLVQKYVGMVPQEMLESDIKKAIK